MQYPQNTGNTVYCRGSVIDPRDHAPDCSCSSLWLTSIMWAYHTTCHYPGKRSEFKVRFLLNSCQSHTIVKLKNCESNCLRLGTICIKKFHSKVLSHIYNVDYKARIQSSSPFFTFSSWELENNYSWKLVYNCLRQGISREVSLAHLCSRAKDSSPVCKRNSFTLCLSSLWGFEHCLYYFNLWGYLKHSYLLESHKMCSNIGCTFLPYLIFYTSVISFLKFLGAFWVSRVLQYNTWTIYYLMSPVGSKYHSRCSKYFCGKAWILLLKTMSESDFATKWNNKRK